MTLVVVAAVNGLTSLLVLLTATLFRIEPGWVARSFAMMVTLRRGLIVPRLHPAGACANWQLPWLGVIERIVAFATGILSATFTPRAATRPVFVTLMV